MNGADNVESACQVLLPPKGTIEFIKEIAQQLKIQDIPRELTVSIALKVAGKFAEEFGSQNIYFSQKGSQAQDLMETTLAEELIKHRIILNEMNMVVRDIAKSFIGYSGYIPKAKMNDICGRDHRNKSIQAEHYKEPTYSKVVQLSKEHGLSVRRVYAIIREKIESSIPNIRLDLRVERPGIPRKRTSRMAERNKTIVAEYLEAPAVKTVQRLAEKHGLQPGGIYNILWHGGCAEKRGTRHQDKAKRDAEIMSDWHKAPFTATIKLLACKYKLDQRTIRDIVKK